MVPPCGFPPPSVSFRLRAFNPKTRAFVALLGPCYKTGCFSSFRLSGGGFPKERVPPLIREAVDGRRIVVVRRPIQACVAHRTDSNRPLPLKRQVPHWRERVSSLRFHALLTPSSGYFSSFAHATCSLSVSHSYLALDGIYHLLRAAIPNNPTLRVGILRTARAGHEAFTLSGEPFQETYRAHKTETRRQTTIRLRDLA